MTFIGLCFYETVYKFLVIEIKLNKVIFGKNWFSVDLFLK